MSIYILGIVVFTVVLAGSIGLFIYFKQDEKNLKEVEEKQLLTAGKKYHKKELEDAIFENYVKVLDSIQYQDLNGLKDIVSDQVYNDILFKLKQHQDNHTKELISNIQKEFCRLISFQIQEDVEIAKFWIKYSDIEYVTRIQKRFNEQGKEEISEIIVSGSDKDKVSHELILTFVRNRDIREEVICPSCGLHEHMLVASRCIQCGSEIVPKKMHWVLTSEVTTNITNQK